MLGKLNQEQIEDLLHTQSIGRIGCHVNGETYVVPITYAYDGKNIIGHSAEGKKIFMMRENPEVCFEIDRMIDMANWQSVIAWGTYEELHGDEAIEGMQKLITKFMQTITSQTMPQEPALAGGHGASSIVKAVVYKIHIKEKSGRFEMR